MFVCTLPVVRKMCDAKVIFSVLSSPNVRNQILTMENNRQNYSPVMLVAVFLGGNLAEKKILDLLATSFP